jgi:aspartyl-tRNA(Asn)/glutamyl-tRNA(Gln) amidotransferase subunit C
MITTVGSDGTRLGHMSVLSRDEVAHLTRLARIDASDAELDQLSGQLGVILESVARVGEVAADDVPPMSHPLPLTNVTRPDEPQPSLTPQQALAGAPASDQQRFRVPRILEDD